ncbi:hypothetical protein E1H13_13285 [Nodosilinea sp. P-1105]|nr:hypothetical protein [Nodosilinea sp. P-1105]
MLPPYLCIHFIIMLPQGGHTGPHLKNEKRKRKNENPLPSILLLLGTAPSLTRGLRRDWSDQAIALTPTA